MTPDMYISRQEPGGHLAILPTVGTNVNFLILVTVSWLRKMFTIGEIEKLWSTFAIILYSKRKNLKTWNKNQAFWNNITICKSIISCSLAYVVVLNLPKGKKLCQGYTTSIKFQPNKMIGIRITRCHILLLYLQIKVNGPEFNNHPHKVAM